MIKAFGVSRNHSILGLRRPTAVPLGYLLAKPLDAARFAVLHGGRRPGEELVKTPH